MTYHTSDVARVWASAYAAELGRQPPSWRDVEKTESETLFIEDHEAAQAAANEAVRRFFHCFQLKPAEYQVVPTQ